MTNLPKLDFLYFNLEETEENYINKNDIYWDAFEGDGYDFKNYIKSCTFNELIYIMLYIYIDKYPRGEFSRGISLDSNDEDLCDYVHKNGRQVTETVYKYFNFFRKDVLNMKVQCHIENYTNDEVIDRVWQDFFYLQNLFIQFTNPIPLDIVESVLKVKEYTKAINNNIIIYTVKDSPIATIEINENSIKLIVNEDKVINYVSI